MQGENPYAVQKDYDNCSKSALYRHIENHLAPQLSKLALRGERFEPTRQLLDMSVILQRVEEHYQDANKLFLEARAKWEAEGTREWLDGALAALDRRGKPAETLVRLMVAWKEKQDPEASTWDEMSKRVVALPHQGDSAVIEYKPAEVEIKPKKKDT